MKMLKFNLGAATLLFASLTSAAFIPGGTAPEDALRKRAELLTRIARDSDNPRYLGRIFKRATQPTCPKYFNPCAGGVDAGCCAWNENCVVVTNQLGCCAFGDICDGQVQTRTTVSIPNAVTLTGTKFQLPTIDINLGTIGGIHLTLPGINLPGGVSTTYKQIVLDTPNPRVTGGDSKNNATYTPTPTGSYASLFETGTANGTANGTAEGTATGSSSESATRTITSGASLSTSTATVTKSTVSTTTSSNGARGVGANRVELIWYAFSGLFAILVGFAVAA